MRKTYPSDISRKQFEHILPILESARKKTKPRTVELYDVFCGLLYVLRTGSKINLETRPLYGYSTTMLAPYKSHKTQSMR